MSASSLKQRLAAILAADVAGYSRLMATDERSTVAALDSARNAFRSCIESNQGRVIDMAGDSVLAVFETAIGAVSAALAVQQQMNSFSSAVADDRRMRFRIGVHMGDVIEKDDGTIYGDGVNIAARLEGLAEPGGISVSESIRIAVKGKVSAIFNDLGEQKVKNIADPIRAYQVHADGAAAATHKPMVSEIGVSLTDKPFVAVLPFANMSGDPEQEYFSDSITDDIITELSHYHSLFVIAKNSAFTYKGKAVDVRTVSKELGVRYVLEGSIRRAADRVRVTAQLIDAHTGKHLWAERYERVLEDIFAVQEEVTRSIVAAIAPEIGAAEISKVRARRQGDLSAYEYVLLARADCLAAIRTTDSSLRAGAISAAKKALLIESGSQRALSTLAHAIFQDVSLRTAVDFQNSRSEGMDAVQRAIRLDLSDNYAYVVKGMFLFFTSQAPDAPIRDDAFDEGLSDLRRAHELNPNDPLALRILALAEASSGNPVQAIEYLNKCLRNNPRDRWRCEAFAILSIANFLAKDYVSGIKWGLQAVREASKMVISYPSLAVNYVGLGEIDKAKAALETARGLAPEYVQVQLDGFSTHRVSEYRKRYTTFLRIAASLENLHEADALR